MIEIKKLTKSQMRTMLEHIHGLLYLEADADGAVLNPDKEQGPDFIANVGDIFTMNNCAPTEITPVK